MLEETIISLLQSTTPQVGVTLAILYFLIRRNNNKIKDQQKKIDCLENKIDYLEQSIEEIKNNITEIKTDIKWIVKSLNGKK